MMILRSIPLYEKNEDIASGAMDILTISQNCKENERVFELYIVRLLIGR
jgi:hypothetical protein